MYLKEEGVTPMSVGADEDECCDGSCADGRNRAAMVARSRGLGPETREG